jgi:hypothetical protein
MLELGTDEYNYSRYSEMSTKFKWLQAAYIKIVGFCENGNKPSSLVVLPSGI